MLGAITGDVVGSTYERANLKSKAIVLFPPGSRFTDDTVLTVALAEALISGRKLAETLRAHHARYPDAGFGPTFRAWVEAVPGTPPPRSASNGAAMRVSPVGWAFDSLDAVLQAARDCTVLTHDHPDAVAGAQAVAAAVFLARQGAGKDEIRARVEALSGYDLGVPLDAVRPHYAFELACAGSVPHAIRAFLESRDVEDALRNAVSLGGDSDTLACIAGAIAEAFYGGVPAHLARPAWAALDEPLRAVTRRFCRAHAIPLPADG